MKNDKLLNEAITYADRVWPSIEGYFHVLEHSQQSDIQDCDSRYKGGR